MKRWVVIIPSIVVLALIAILGYGLTRDPRVLPSALINKPMPAFDLPTLADPNQHIRRRQVEGHVALINVWASWCVACRSEVTLLQQITQRTSVPIIGIGYKDKPGPARHWLRYFGNPFAVVGLDQTGDTSINWGVSGVPETFVIDKNGYIRDKVVGPITEHEMRDKLIPEINRLKASS